MNTFLGFILLGFRQTIFITPLFYGRTSGIVCSRAQNTACSPLSLLRSTILAPDAMDEEAKQVAVILPSPLGERKVVVW
jgi:hypothetical protein